MASPIILLLSECDNEGVRLGMVLLWTSSLALLLLTETSPLAGAKGAFKRGGAGGEGSELNTLHYVEQDQRS